MFDSDAWLEAAYDDSNGALVDSDNPPDGWGWLPCKGTADCEADLHEAPCRSLQIND